MGFFLLHGTGVGSRAAEEDCDGRVWEEGLPGMKTEATLPQDGILGSGNVLTASGSGQGGGSFSSTKAFSSAPAFLSDPIEQPKPGRRLGGPNDCWWTQGFPSVAAHRKCLGDPHRNYSVPGCNSGNLVAGLWSRAWESVFQQPQPLGLSGHGSPGGGHVSPGGLPGGFCCCHSHTRPLANTHGP